MSLQKSEVQIKAFFHCCSLCAHFTLVCAPFPLFPFRFLLPSLFCNDHSSALQEPVPFSTACSLIQPALGSSAPACSGSRRGSSLHLVLPNDHHLSHKRRALGISDNAHPESGLGIHWLVIIEYFFSPYAMSPLCQRQT